MNSASVQVCLDFPGLFLWLCCETDKKVCLYKYMGHGLALSLHI